MAEAKYTEAELNRFCKKKLAAGRLEGLKEALKIAEAAAQKYAATEGTMGESIGATRVATTLKATIAAAEAKT